LEPATGTSRPIDVRAVFAALTPLFVGVIACLGIAQAVRPHPVICALATDTGNGRVLPCPQPSRDWSLPIESGVLVTLAGWGTLILARRSGVLSG
jgi:hypothetical protein